MEDLKKVWNNLLEETSKKISMVEHDLWFKTLIPLSIDSGKLILVAPVKSVKETLKTQKYKEILLESIKNLNYSYLSDYTIINTDEINSYKTNSIKKDKIEEEKNIPQNTNNFNEKYTFENFVVGEFNSIARAAAFAVAKNPGGDLNSEEDFYNPLFIYGGVGLGKTHILHAIGNYVLEHNPEMNILYTTTEQFVSDFIESISNSKNIEKNFKFREKYRNVDILMLDDIQFLAGKVSSQEAIFHTFNDLHGLKKQIIITSDRSPKDLTFLEPRLKSRFNSGLTVDIGEPDLETRIAILQKKALQKNFNISKVVINYIAENITSNIRELEGALTKVIFYCKINNMDSADDISTAIEALKDIIDVSNHIISVDSIINTVCSYYNVKKEDLVGNKKNKQIVLPRQIAIYLIRDILSLTTTDIGNYFGGRDHTTIMYASNKIAELLEKDNLTKIQIKDIKNILNKN